MHVMKFPGGHAEAGLGRRSRSRWRWIALAMLCVALAGCGAAASGGTGTASPAGSGGGAGSPSRSAAPVATPTAAQPTARSAGLAAGLSQFCGIFSPGQQAQILQTGVEGATATLGGGDYTCTFKGGPLRTQREVVATLELNCDPVNGGGQWQEFLQYGTQVPDDPHGVRELSKLGMALGVKLANGCVLTADGAVSLGAKPVLAGAPALRAAMDAAAAASPHT
jgi:hypothetical protein